MKMRSRRSQARFSPSSTNHVTGLDIREHPPCCPRPAGGRRNRRENKRKRE